VKSLATVWNDDDYMIVMIGVAMIMKMVMVICE
jgi:hypothetical protein